MLISSLITVVLASLASTTLAQDIVYDSIHNATVIYGTWSSGSKAVLTGSGFANPVNMSFNYPANTGVSYSFSQDGFYEISRYRFNSNGSDPTCITGVIGWVHGSYTLNPNGSISMIPMGDGFQQIQDPCAAISNFIEVYNQTEYYQSWRIFQDPNQGYKLHLFQFDGSPVAPQFQISTTPKMLPTQPLRNVAASSVQRRDVSSAPEALGPHRLIGVLGGGVLALVFATVSLL
ncbi:chaperone for protein-folding within the ER, fungal-domain-containing protein [Pholiota molesta]|nr:chaperone for protein-folding within the ER, fungal-domain-containing protein [Pholiota molesta]